MSVEKKFVENAPQHPGVYQMLSKDGAILYVGKAKNLKKRLGSYLHLEKQTPKIQHMLLQVDSIELTICQHEEEALILEENLIKTIQPKYNSLLRDDKSFPYILFTDHEFPKLTIQRQSGKYPGVYFGPYTQSMLQILQMLYRNFKLRSCSDHIFNTRSRPCLEYYIKRCSAPCVNKITAADYAISVKGAQKFLSGNNAKHQDLLKQKMLEASAAQEFEKAAIYKDQLQFLQNVKLAPKKPKFHSGKPQIKTGIFADIFQELSGTYGRPISRIEAYDNSHLFGSNPYGAMVVALSDGFANSLYRIFKPKKLWIPGDDYGLLEEVLQRRMQHTNWKYPDIILIDGGKGQVNVASKTIHGIESSVIVLGICKGKDRKNDYILNDAGESIALPAKIFHFLQNMRNEVHRFVLKSQQNNSLKSIRS